VIDRADTLRAVLDSVFAGPGYQWVERPEPLGVVQGWLRLLQQRLLDLREANPLGFRLLLAGMILLVVAIFLHAGWVFLKTIRAAAESPDAGLPGRPAIRDRAWYRAEADRLAAAGRYADAMQYDFLALILALDAASLLRFHPSKTPGEYSREARLPAEAGAAFRALVRTLYLHVFARRPCGPEEFAAWRARLDPERYASA
jgi:hypothetical protein